MFHVCLCYSVLSVPCSLVIIWWERSDLLASSFVCDVYENYAGFIYHILIKIIMLTFNWSNIILTDHMLKISHYIALQEI